MTAKEAEELSKSVGGIRDTSYEDYNTKMLSELLTKINEKAKLGLYQVTLIIAIHREEVVDSLRELGYIVKVDISPPGNWMSSEFITYSIKW